MFCIILQTISSCMYHFLHIFNSPVNISETAPIELKGITIKYNFKYQCFFHLYKLLIRRIRLQGKNHISSVAVRPCTAVTQSREPKLMSPTFE